MPRHGDMGTGLHYIEVRFVIFLSCGFTTVAVINPPERKLAKCNFVCIGHHINPTYLNQENQGHNHEKILDKAKPMGGHNLSLLVEIGLTYPKV